MRHIILTLAILVISPLVKSQNLSLTDLQYVCKKNSWESVNQYLISRGWEFYDSEKETDENYGSISWSYNKSYNGKSEGWLHLLISKEIPSKVTYLMFNQPAYLKIQNAIGNNGYKSTGSEIDDDEITSTYSSSTYVLEIATLKRERDSDIFTYSENYTAYRISLIKKGSIFDGDNGPKVEYWPGSTRVQISYILKDGKLNGPFTKYYRNGEIKRTGSFLMDQEHGLFKEYDEDGDLSVEYQQKNDELSGMLKTYYSNGNVNRIENYVKGQKNGPFTQYHKNGKISKTGSFLENMEHGLFKEYNEEGDLEVEYQQKNDELSGPLKAYFPNGKVKIDGNYASGQKNGEFKEYAETGELSGTYTMKEGEMHGTLVKYKQGNISEELTYEDGALTGPYSNYHYDENGILQFREKGNFKDDEKNGRWDVFLVEDGKSERLIDSHFFTDGVKDGSFQEIKQDSLIFGSYSNGKLDGPYLVYRDRIGFLFGKVISTDTSEMTIHCRGNYMNGLKSGAWKNYDISGVLRSKGAYVNGSKTGKWYYYYPNFVDLDGKSATYSKELYLEENYKNGKMEGENIRYSSLKKVKHPCDTIRFSSLSSKDTCERQVYQKQYEKFTYSNDELNGPCLVKDSLDQVIFKGAFISDMKHGLWLESSIIKGDDGKEYSLLEEGKYEKGKRDGKWVKFFYNQKPFEITHYLKGELHGYLDQVHNDGSLKERKRFAFGELKELVAYDSTGNRIIRHYEILAETPLSIMVRVTTFDSTESRIIDHKIKKENSKMNYEFFELFVLSRITYPSEEYGGFPMGKFVKKDLEGNMFVSGELNKKGRTGLWKFWYADQNVILQLMYEENTPIKEEFFMLDSELPFSGTFMLTYAETGKVEEIKLKNGLRHGTTISKNSKGEVIGKEKYKNGILK